MTSSVWVAIGAVAASLAGPGLRPDVLILLASATAVGAAGVHGRAAASPAGRRRIAAALPLAAGAVAVAVRLALAVGSAPDAVALPDGGGPWAGRVVAISSPRQGAQVATIELRTEAGTGSSSPVVDVAATLPRYPQLEPGDIVRVQGRIEPRPAGPYGEYLARIGVDGTLMSRQLEITGRAADVGAALEQLRRSAGDALAAAVPEPEAGLAAGIVIGLRDRVDRDLAAAFTAVGASHVVAISGWNIAIVAATVLALFGGVARRRRALLLIAAIVAYVVFAGASPSVVRAAAMAGVVLLARETGRAGRASAALGWAAAILLVVEPSLVSDPGFQLSTLATGGILAWANPWTERLGRIRGGRVPRWLAESLGVSLAAQAATLPVVLLTFGRLAIVSPVVNLAIVPLVAPAMAASLVALLAGAATLAGGPVLVATLGGLPAWALLTAMCTIIRAAATLPIANVSIAPPWTMFAATTTAAVILVGPPAWRIVRARRRATAGRHGDVALARARVRDPHGGADPQGTGDRDRAGSARNDGEAGRVDRRPAATSRFGRLGFVALAVASLALAVAFAHRTDGTTRITVLDVGQGDAILVEGGRGGRLLIDGGPDPNRLLVELDRRLPPWDRRLDLVVLTHPHEDHVAGLPILLERYRVGHLYETGMRGPGPGYGAFARGLGGVAAPPRSILATGARITLDDIQFRVLWPDPGRVPREPPDAGRGINDVSVVLLGEVAGRRFLLTGDVEDDVDPILTGRGLPSVDILKVAHHGSATASTPAFLDAVRPSVAIVSAGAGNPYRHPARSTIDRLRSTGARVLRTDTDGSVAVSIARDGQIAVGTSGARRAAVAGHALAELDLARSAFAAAFDRVPERATRVPERPAGAPEGLPARAMTPSFAPVRLAFACGIPSSG